MFGLHVCLSCLSIRATSDVLFWCCFHVIGIVAFFRSIMARSLDKIKSIDGLKETLKLSVRISDLWFIGTLNKSEQAKMVFVDSDGDEIHVVCKQDQLKECVLEDIPFRKYRFARFADVLAGQFEPGLLVDVIGVVEEVVFGQVSGKGRRVVFKLKDLSQQLLSCTLWDDYCLQFLKFLDDYEGDGPITVLLTHGRIKEAQGSYPPSVSNFFKVSKLIINQPVMEIQEFNEWLAELGIEARSGFKSHGEGSTQLSGSIQLSSKEPFFGKTEAKTIDDINTISELAFSAIKKSDAEMVPFTCACGKYNKEVVLRYRLEVMINQEMKAQNSCFGTVNADGDVDLNASPQALDKLLGYELAFKIKVQPKFRNFAVLKCSTDSSLINVVMDMLADAETSSKMNIPVSDSNHSAQHESQSLSVTADHDPLLGLPLTPTKRQAFQDCDDEARTSQISPAQLSPNK
ncbi:hypothetical protein GmHk_04G010167 [Glycine max]|nr:hypothetical protein GmHk_04G010167 [Glycine max]